jgi:CBS-domain-containing membrane protein
MNVLTPSATPPAPANENSFYAKLRGQAVALPPRASNKQIVVAGLGGVIAIGTVAGLAVASNQPLVLGSFGASCVLLFGFPESPFSQPRNVVFGHLLSSLVGLIAQNFLGAHWWSVALAAGSAIALMMLTRTVHPPAGSNPVIVHLAEPDWSFLLLPTAAGALLLVIIAAVYLNLTQKTAYPKYWLGRG